MSQFIPPKQQTRRFPDESMSQALAIRRVRVSAFLAVSIQRIQSRLARGVISFQASCAFGRARSALFRSAVASEGFQETSKDFRSQISKVKAANPDIIYFLGYAGQTVPALKQIADLKYKVAMFGGDAWDDQQIITDAGAAAEGIYFTVPSSHPDDNFKAAMKAKVGTDEIAVCTPTAYDGINILAQVLKNVGVDPTAIKDELYKTVYTGGVSTNEISFDSNGDPKIADYTVKMVKNGTIEVVQ